MTDLRLSQLNDGGHGDAAAYLLGALDERSRERFEAHMNECAACLHDLRSLQPVADSLALAAPQVEPSAHLAASIVASARAVSDALDVDPFYPGRAPMRAAVVPAAVPLAVAPRPAWRRWTERVSTGVAAAALLVAAAGAGYAFVQHQEVQHTAQTAAQLSETLAIMYQPGMVSRTLNSAEGAPQAKGKIFLAPDGTQAVLMTYDLPKLPNQQAYQLWLNNTTAGKRDSGGTFTVDEQGRGHLIVRAPAALASYNACGVTLEPANGSKWPTGQRVLAGEL
jgi:hypothetical protein